MSSEARTLNALEPSDAIREEWVAAIDSLYREAEAWAGRQGWTSVRRSKLFEEPGSGTYRAWRLSITAGGKTVVFEPFARQIMGGRGLIDLFPPRSRDAAVMIVRHDDGRWMIHPFGDGEVGESWTEPNLIRTLCALFETSSI